MPMYYIFTFEGQKLQKTILNDPWADTDPTFLGSPGPSMNHLGKFNSL